MKRFSWSSKKSFRWIAGILIVLAAAVVFFYHATILEVEGERYIASMSKASKDLNSGCRRVATASERLLVTESSPALTGNVADIQNIKKEVQLLRIDLGEFKRALDTLPPRPYTFSSANYNKSLSLKEQSEATIAQVDEVLDEYEGLLTFLMSYYTTRHQLSEELSSFNELTDLDALAGQGFTYDQIADSLDKKTAELSELTPPRGFEDITHRTITLHRGVAEGFRELARSLFIPTDTAIYGAATQLEQLTAENYQLSGSELDSVLENSPILKSVDELPEITDRFRF